MKKIFGLLSSTLLVGLISLGTFSNVKTNKKDDVVEAPTTLEVKDVLREDLKEENERTVRKAAAPAAEYVMSDAKIQVSTPDADGTVNVRFVAAIDSFDYESANFTIEMFAEDGTTSLGKITRSVTKAYTGIQLGDQVKTAADIFGEGHNYFIAYTLDDMPKDAWENGFKVTTGLKKVEDEDYTTKLTDEVKVVKTVVMKENHLVFDWEPYGNTWASMEWENDFVAGAVSDLDPAIPNYGDLVTQVVKTNIKAEIIDKEGNVFYSTNGTHCSGNADNTKRINMEVSGIDLRANEYMVKVSVTLADGTEVTGVKNFESLPDIQNAKVTNTEGKYILTFDDVPNASQYKYRIFNEEVNGNEISVESGDEIDVVVLKNGTYSVELVAISERGNITNYAPSSVILENVIVIEKLDDVVLNGNDKFKFELYHESNAWEFVMRFKPLDNNDLITSPNRITDFVVSRDGVINNTNFEDQTSNGVNASNTYPYYDTATGYYTFGFNQHESPAKDKLFDMSFNVTTDKGITYAISLKFIAFETIAAIAPTIEEVNEELINQQINAYKTQLTIEYGKYDSANYTVANFAELTRIYNEAMLSYVEIITVEDAKALYDATVAAMKEVPWAMVELTFTYASASSKDNSSSSVIDKKDNTRWQAETMNEGEWISVGFLDGQSRNIKKISIKFEAAGAKEYFVEYSTDNEIWKEVVHRKDIERGYTDVIELTNSITATYIRVRCIECNHDYPFSVYEIRAWE